MSELKITEVEFQAAIDLLKRLDPEERGPVILALEHDYKGISDRIAIGTCRHQSADGQGGALTFQSADAPPAG